MKIRLARARRQGTGASPGPGMRGVTEWPLPPGRRCRGAALAFPLDLGARPLCRRLRGRGCKPFNITVIQAYAPTSNAEEAVVEWFYEDLQDLLELTPKKDVLFIIGDWNAKVGSQDLFSHSVIFNSLRPRGL